jgi:hypothetical protein
LRQIYEYQWDSLQDMEIQTEEQVFDSWGRLKREHRFTFALGPEGRRSVSLTLTEGDKVTAGYLREDGRRRYEPRPLFGHPDIIENVTITRQLSGPDTYEGPKFVALWAFMPGGKSLARWLAEGASLNPIERSGRQGLEIVASLRDRALRLQLDPDHAWLPSAVILEGALEVHVQRFGEDQGHWFPMEGDEVATREGGNENIKFVVSSLRINRGVDPSLFGMPPIPDGAQITDQITSSRRVKGSHEARQRLLSLSRAAVLRPQSVPTGPIVVPRNPPHSHFTWSLAIGGMSIAVIAIALMLRLRGKL